MLSDAIKERRLDAAKHVHGGHVLTSDEAAAMELTFLAWEIEARNLEEQVRANERIFRAQRSTRRGPDPVPFGRRI